MSNSKCAPESDESKKRNAYSLQLNRWFLIPIGAWPPFHTSGLVRKIFVLLQILICTNIVASIMIPCSLYVLFEDVTIQAKLSAFGPLLHRIMGSVNYWVLIRRRSDIHNLIRHMETDWNLIQRLDDREVMLQHAKYGRFIAMICGVIMQGGTFFFSLEKAMKTVTIIVDNQTFTMHPMTCPIYSKIMDTRFSPLNEIALVVQFTSTFIVSSSTVGACSLAAVFAIHANGQLNVLYTWLNELVEDHEKENDTAKRKLGVIVEHHLRILRYFTR